PIEVGVFYSVTCTSSGGGGGVAFWNHTALPPGLSALFLLSSSINIQGTPQTSGDYSFTLTGRDDTITGGGTTVVSKTFSGVIQPPPSVSCPPAPALALGTPFSIPCTVSGGTPPYAFALVPGAPPPPAWLILNPASGILS